MLPKVVLLLGLAKQQVRAKDDTEKCAHLRDRGSDDKLMGDNVQGCGAKMGIEERRGTLGPNTTFYNKDGNNISNKL